MKIRSASAGQLPSIAEGGGVGGWPLDGGCRLRPQETYNAVVHHDLKVMGESTLMCSVTYEVRLPTPTFASGIQPGALPTVATVGPNSSVKGWFIFF